MKLDAYNILQYKQGDLLFGYRPNTPPGSVFKLGGSFPFKISKATLSPVIQTSSVSIIDYLKIPANTVSANTVIDIQAILEKSGVAAGALVNVGISTDSISTGIQISTYTVGLTLLYINTFRSLCVTTVDGSGNGTYLFDDQVSALNDNLTITNTAPVSLAIDWTVDQYIIVSGSVSNTADSLRTLGIKAVV